MRRLIRRWLPSPEKVRDGGGVRWMRPLLKRPWLWQINRDGIARGASIGVFFGFLIPIAQIPLSAIAAVVLRGNLPVAVVSTLVSNPFTYAPIFIFAHRIGRGLLGEDAEAVNGAAGQVASVGAWQTVLDMGAPLMTGLALFAVIGGVFTWCLVQGVWIGAHALRVWRLQRRIERRSERRKTKRQTSSPRNT